MSWSDPVAIPVIFSRYLRRKVFPDLGKLVYEIAKLGFEVRNLAWPSKFFFKAEW